MEASIKEFKQIHLSLIDALEDERRLAEEQAVLDEVLNLTDELATKLQILFDSSNKSKPDDECRALSQRLSRLQRTLAPHGEALTELEGTERPGVSHLKAYDEQFREYKQELKDIEVKLFSFGDG